MIQARFLLVFKRRGFIPKYGHILSLFTFYLSPKGFGNLVERAINRIKQFRRIASRYEKLAQNYTAMLTIALILLWL